MASSNEMVHLRANINALKKKKEQYEKFCPKLEKLANTVSPIKGYINSSEKSFSKGGYSSGGKTLSAGDVKKKGALLGDAVEQLRLAAQKTKLKAVEFQNRINELERQYEIAERAQKAAEKAAKNKKK